MCNFNKKFKNKILPDATVQLQAFNSNSVDTLVDKTPTPIGPLPSCSSSSTPGPPRVPFDLGEDKPNQVKLRRFPLRLCYNQHRSFVASWYTSREWLEYSVEADAAFCFPCRKYLISPSDSAFTVRGFCDWKHAVEAGKGLNKHAASKEHITSMTLWKDREKRAESGLEISTMVNSNQLARNRYYLSSVVDMIEFLVVNHLPLRGSTDAFDSLTEDGSGLFLSLFEYTLRKDPELRSVMKSIPRNATYSSHEIQNDIIANMSSLVTEEIVREVADSWYTIKVDGTRDPTGMENISIIVRFVKDNYQVTERLLSMTTTEKGDAQTLTNTIITELEKNGLSTSKILSQVYDGASLMSGKNGGVQKILQDKLGRVIPYVHCFNHQLHLVVVHAISTEPAVEDFFNVCNLLYKFIKKPTVAVLYGGQQLKRLLEQRWTGHLQTVKTILNSFQEITELLAEINGNRRYETEVRMEAAGLIREVSETSFKFIAHMVYKILLLLDAPNKLMQSEDMDLLSAVKLVTCASECLTKLRSESDFLELWEKADDTEMPRPPKRKRTINKGLQEYLLEESIGQAQGDLGNQQELRRLFYSTLDAVLAEISERFGERNSKLIEALSAFDPQCDSTFLDAQLVQDMMNLTNSEVIHSEFVVARQFLRKVLARSISSGEKLTLKQILQEHHTTLEAMPSVLAAMKCALTFGASTATCENSFSTLKNVFTDNRRSMLHQRKAHLVQLAFERDLTRKFRDEWKETLLRRFNESKRRRLQLF
uniref:TTF-type domain-containing protein n=1 Tax=Cyprinus carpio TaxID=7962 RepID=A0A8C1TJI1_CYPCA